MRLLAEVKRRDNREAMEQLIKDGEDINGEDNNGRTVLSWAAEKGHMQAIQMLLEQGNVDVNSVDNDGRTALLWAVERGNPWVVELLIQRNDVNVNFADDDGRTALSWAADNGNEQMVRMLLNKIRTNVNSADKTGRTALLWAAEQDHVEVVEQLLKADNINVNSADNDGRTALSWAAKNGNEEVVEMLLKKDHIEVNSEDSKKLAELLLRKDGIDAGFATTQIVVDLLHSEKGYQINTKDNNGRTALLWATQERILWIVLILLRKDNIDVNSTDNYGRTALSWAAEKDHVEVVEQLLKADNINVNSADNSGRTALLWATEKDHVGVVEQLLKADNINVNSTDNSGRTALLRAIEKSSERVVETLLKEDNIDVNSADKTGRTALLWAAERGDRRVVGQLLEKDNIDVNSADNDGRTALSWAAEKGYAGVVGQLLKIDRINLNCTDNNGWTPLWHALEKGHQTIVNFFARKDIITLRIAIAHKRHDLVTLLLDSTGKTKDIMAEDWRDAYVQQPLDTVLLSEEGGQLKSVRRIGEREIRHELASWSAKIGTRRLLFLVSDFLPWQSEKIPGWDEALQLPRGQMLHSRKDIGGSCICFCVAVWFPTGEGLEQEHWTKSAIAWTMLGSKNRNGGLSKSINHISTLPYGWIPEDGVDFFKQFMLCLKDRWFIECKLAEGVMAKRRGDQLRGKGENPDLIHNLAADAQKLADYHAFLAGQVAHAQDFAKILRPYHGEGVMKELQNVIDGFADDIGLRISQLDQTIRDLLQFEFAWVSINEAHRSTSLATSMKRLSWITFVFLPAMFASSVFGMNVDLLKNNPDWRWYVLFGGTVLIITSVIWLIFKFNPNMESSIERQMGKMVRWMNRKKTQNDIEKAEKRK